MKRVLSVWLPTFATDRLRRQLSGAGWRPRRLNHRRHRRRRPRRRRPADRGGRPRRLAAAGCGPALSLADARALLPALAVPPADPAADRRALAALADWCGRYTPWTAIDEKRGIAGEFGGGAGLWLDVTGCAHLCRRRRPRCWTIWSAASRRSASPPPRPSPTPPAPPGRSPASPPSTAADQLVAPGEAVAALMPAAGRARCACRRRSSAALAPDRPAPHRRPGARCRARRSPPASATGCCARLDQALGRLDEPLSPRRPPPAVRRPPRLRRADRPQRGHRRRGRRHLLADLCARLAAAHQGARRLELARSTGRRHRRALRHRHQPAEPRARPPGAAVRASRSTRIDPGFGIEAMTLAAGVVEPLRRRSRRSATATAAPADGICADLVDRLANRLGGRRASSACAPRRATCPSGPAGRSRRWPAS